VSAFFSRALCRFDLPDQPAELDTERGVLLCANHRSLFDLIVTYVLLGRRWRLTTRCLVNGKYFKTPGLGWLLRVTGCIPVPSSAGDQAIDEATAVLDQGGCVAVMPEGRLVPDDDRIDGIGPIRLGVGRLAVGVDLPVVVVGCVGSDRVWPISKLPRPHLRRPTVAVRLRVLPPFAGSADEARDTIVAVMSEVVAEAEAAVAQAA